MGYVGMARHSVSAFNESQATRLLADYLESSRKIKTFFKENDRTPNYDGSMELVGYEGVPTKQFIVQIKKVENLAANIKGDNKGKYVYRLETNFLYYVKGKVTESPAIYFVVDIVTHNIFWLYLSDAVLMNLDFEGKEYVSYPFSETEIIGNLDEFINKLERIAAERNSIFLQKTPEQIAEMQDALDYINRLTENDFRIIKDTVFPNLWRFGIKHSHSDSFAFIVGGKEYKSKGTSLFSLYPQIKGVPDTGLKEYNEDKCNVFTHFDMTAKTLPMDYAKDCLYEIIKTFFENGIPMEYLPNILLLEKLGNYVRRLKRLYCFRTENGRIPIVQLHRISSLLFMYVQHILLDQDLSPDELVMKKDWGEMLKRGRQNIIDVFNYSSRAANGFNAFCEAHEETEDVLFSKSIFEIVRIEHVEAWAMIATLQQRNVGYYEDVWTYDFYEIVTHDPEVALMEYNKLCIEWFDALQPIYDEVYDKLFDSRKYRIRGKYLYKNKYISNGKSGPWLSRTVCAYKSEGFSIVFDPLCPENFEGENPPVTISRGGCFDDFLSHKTPLYDGLHCLLYAGVCDALGYQDRGLKARYRTLNLL